MSGGWTGQAQGDPVFLRAMADMLDVEAWLAIEHPDLALVAYGWDDRCRPGTVALVHVHRRGATHTPDNEGSRLVLAAVRALGWPPAQDGAGRPRTVLLAAPPPSAHKRLLAWRRVEGALRDQGTA